MKQIKEIAMFNKDLVWVSMHITIIANIMLSKYEIGIYRCTSLQQPIHDHHKNDHIIRNLVILYGAFLPLNWTPIFM